MGEPNFLSTPADPPTISRAFPTQRVPENPRFPWHPACSRVVSPAPYRWRGTSGYRRRHSARGRDSGAVRGIPRFRQGPLRGRHGRNV